MVAERRRTDSSFVSMRARPLPLAALLATLFVSACDRSESEGDAPRRDEAFRSALKERTGELDPRDVGIGRRVRDLAFVDLDGERRSLAAETGDKGIVLVVRDAGCPVSKPFGHILFT